MNRGRQRNTKLRAVDGGASASSSIDLGIALSVYGKDAEGKLIEIRNASQPDPCWYGFSLNETWPTEQ